MGSFHPSETSSESAPPPVCEAMIRDLKVLVLEPSKFSVLLRTGFYQLMHRGKPPADLPSLCIGAPPLPIPQHGLYHLQGPLVGSLPWGLLHSSLVGGHIHNSPVPPPPANFLSPRLAYLVHIRPSLLLLSSTHDSS